MDKKCLYRWKLQIVSAHDSYSPSQRETVTLTILISPSVCLILWMLISALHYLLLYVTAQNPHLLIANKLLIVHSQVIYRPADTTSPPVMDFSYIMIINYAVCSKALVMLYNTQRFKCS